MRHWYKRKLQFYSRLLRHSHFTKGTDTSYHFNHVLMSLSHLCLYWLSKFEPSWLEFVDTSGVLGTIAGLDTSNTWWSSFFYFLYRMFKAVGLWQIKFISNFTDILFNLPPIQIMIMIWYEWTFFDFRKTKFDRF